MRNQTSQIQTAELSDADLDNVSGGLGVSASSAGAADLLAGTGSVGGTIGVDAADATAALGGATGSVTSATTGLV
ncbi:MAG: type A2 lantipeptide [Streptomyces sp.]|uniref:type A2 lantipeptide n=1 Tax=Streptomyces sp. TaxID=1931 RepID=UPI003D6C1306